MNLPGTYKNRIGMDFVLIPAETFMIRSEDGHEDEQPVHTVRITQPFYLGKYMVTQVKWKKVMEKNPSEKKGRWDFV